MPVLVSGNHGTVYMIDELPAVEAIDAAVAHHDRSLQVFGSDQTKQQSTSEPNFTTAKRNSKCTT
jgi:hypothetical protein